MHFGPVPVAEALGTVLAHSLQLGGHRLRKGRVLEAGDIAALQSAGLQDVIVARLGTDDLGEDLAAGQIAQALVPDANAAYLRLTDPGTGRVNIYATVPGVLDLNVPAIEAANRVDPMITIATLPPYARTHAHGMVATVKIIAYGVDRHAVTKSADLASDAMRIRPVVIRNAVLIQTDTGSGPGKGQDAITARLDALGIVLSKTVTVPHKTTPLADAIAQAQADLVLILTASATSDPHDVAPSALRAAGGRVTRFGMPVDPGNLLFLGYTANGVVIGLPGCARSPALNGADWVLERVACGLRVSDADIAAMGVGGLLKESPARPHPREKR